MKKTPLKKKSKSNIRKIQDELWQECRRIILTRYGDKCYTCDKPISGSNRHCGHLIPKAACGAFLKYDLRNLRPQCYFCNINCGGRGAEFYKRMTDIEGTEYTAKLFRDKNITVQALDHYTQLLEQYKLL